MKAIRTAVLLLAATLMAAGCGGKSPEEAAKASLQAMYDGDFDSYKKVSCASMDKETFEMGSQLFKALMDEAEIKVSDIRFEKARINGDEAVVTYTFLGEVSDEVHLEKQGGSWKVVE